MRPKIVSIVVTTLISGLLVSIPVPANAAACNPTPTTASNGDTVLTFTTVGTCEWEVSTGAINARVLVVGGGSSGGAGLAGSWWPQGGGGGAVVDESNVAVTPGQSISVTVGGGGDSLTVQSSASTSVNNGGQSSFATLSAPGGVAPVTHGGTGGRSGNGNTGGIGGAPTSGGGGGAGGNGNGIVGGVGVNSDISGTTFMYGSGGAGSNVNTGGASSGGGSNSNPPTANRGGGGSQPTSGTGTGSPGAAGVVIVRYLAIPVGSSALIFNANGATGAKNALIVVNNTATALPDATGFTNQGYVFTGWNTAANGSGTPYALGASITTSTKIR